MSHTDYRTLIARGRKAGLTTGELYAALAARPPEGADQQPGQSDGNGYAPGYNCLGQRVYLSSRIRSTTVRRKWFRPPPPDGFFFPTSFRVTGRHGRGKVGPTLAQPPRRLS